MAEVVAGPHGGVWIELPGKPERVNGMSKNSYWMIAREIKTWRHMAGWAGKTMSPLTPPVLVYVHEMATGRLRDAGANYFAAKGALDGLVDAGVLPDDAPRYVRGLYFVAPIKADRDLLALELVEVAP